MQLHCEVEQIFVLKQYSLDLLSPPSPFCSLVDQKSIADNSLKLSYEASRRNFVAESRRWFPLLIVSIFVPLVSITFYF